MKHSLVHSFTASKLLPFVSLPFKYLDEYSCKPQSCVMEKIFLKRAQYSMNYADFGNALHITYAKKKSSFASQELIFAQGR